MKYNRIQLLEKTTLHVLRIASVSVVHATCMVQRDTSDGSSPGCFTDCYIGGCGMGLQCLVIFCFLSRGLFSTRRRPLPRCNLRGFALFWPRHYICNLNQCLIAYKICQDRAASRRLESNTKVREKRKPAFVLNIQTYDSSIEQSHRSFREI